MMNKSHALASPPQTRPSSLTASLKIKPGLIRPALLTMALVFVALLAPWLATHDPTQQDLLNSLMTPSAANWLGTDDQGRDIYSRLLFGLRLDLLAAVGAVLIGFLIGTPLGVAAGLLGGRVERLFMRLVDATLAIPPILLIMSVIAVLGRDYTHSMLALGIIFSFGFIRIARGEAKLTRGSTYVLAARGIGVSTGRLISRHILPGALPALITQIGLFLPVALLISASLSYLGLGVQSPQSSLGAMLQAAQEVSLTAPWQVLPPGILLVIAALILNFLAEALSDSLRPRGDSDPLLATAAGTLRPRRPTELRERDVVLAVRNLGIEVADPLHGPRMAVRDVSFALKRGEVLAVVGESGSGKTLTSMAIPGLVPAGARVREGSIRVAGAESTGVSLDRLRHLRAHEVAVIFQNPLACLNPSQTIGQQLVKPLMRLKGLSKAEAHARVIALLNEVGIPEPERRLAQYAHELSGGLAQRVVIAQALSRDPLLLIADEATSALDVTVQYQVLELLKRLGKERGLAILFVTHSMGVVSHIADEVVVMYAGEIVEQGAAMDVVSSPTHPYTMALLDAVPRNQRGAKLPVSPPGAAPRVTTALSQCGFAPRCSLSGPECKAGPISLQSWTALRGTRCIRRPDEVAQLWVRKS